MNQISNHSKQTHGFDTSIKVVKVHRIDTFYKHINITGLIEEEVDQKKQDITDKWYDEGDDGEWKFEKTEFE